jgi:hypothetical protein
MCWVVCLCPKLQNTHPMTVIRIINPYVTGSVKSVMEKSLANLPSNIAGTHWSHCFRAFLPFLKALFSETSFRQRRYDR